MNYEGKKPLKMATPELPPNLPEFNVGAPIEQIALPGQPKRNPALDIPDLEHEDAAPNAAERAAIAAQVNALSFEDKLETKLANDAQAAQSKFKKVPKDPKTVLKEIIARGEYQESFDFLNVRWTMRALDQGDINLAFDEVKDSVSTVVGRMTLLEFIKIVYSIEAINDVPIYEIFDEIKISEYGTNKMAYVLAVKKALQRYLEGFPPVVIDGLFTFYQQIEQKRTEALEALKNS